MRRFNEYGQEEKTTKGRLTGLFGIGLLIIAVIAFSLEQSIMTVLLSIAIVVGAVYCLIRRYKLKLFTIMALVISCFCIFSMVTQGKDMGRISKSHEDGSSSSGSYMSWQDSTLVNYYNNTTTEPKVTEPVTADDTPTQKPKDDEKVISLIGVDPELKAFLDSYEAFIDEYVDFMCKYEDDQANAASMLSDYKEMMQKYEDFSEKCEEYESSEMSVVDMAYYLEVTTRCSMKMMESY